MITVYIGYDSREDINYRLCVNSLLRHTESPVKITPIRLDALDCYQESHSDGSTEFSYTRFLVPYLADFEGWALYIDSDMIFKADVLDLWALRNNSPAVMVCQHNYATKSTTKFLNKTNNNYPRKNWSSMMLWNCGHDANRVLTPKFIEHSSGEFLHRFSWLDDDQLGSVPLEWNWLADEYGCNDQAKLIHYTLGTPHFKGYENTPMCEYWIHELYNYEKRINQKNNNNDQ